MNLAIRKGMKHSMKTQNVYYYEVSGTHEEIGKQLAREMDAKRLYMPAPAFFTDKEVEEALQLYDTYCPGLKEELESFSQEAGISVKDIAYTWMTYLVPRCSGLVVLGGQMADGHTRLARNYEFSIEDEDLTVCRTSAEGKYAHIGGTIVAFGRTEGINECGLAVSMSSCGLPVSNIEGMRASKVKGLQFWAVIRSLLENCKNVEEALKLVSEMPIAYNINLYLADIEGNAVLFETMDSHIAYKQISEATSKKYICGTNHIVLSDLRRYEPMAMRNSIVRYEKLKEFLDTHPCLEEAQIKEFLLKKYPEGMSAYYYKDWFGTIKSVVMDTVEKRYSICWFGQTENGWEDYMVLESIQNAEEAKLVEEERGTREFFEFVPIES